MKNTLYAVAVLLLVVPLIVGCGGAADRLNATSSPFAGMWEGAWTDSTLNQSGSTEIVVDPSGHASGLITNSDLGLQGTVKGSIGDDGKASVTIEYPGQTYTANGTVLIGASGHLVGLLKQYYENTQIGTPSIDLVKR